MGADWKTAGEERGTTVYGEEQNELSACQTGYSEANEVDLVNGKKQLFLESINPLCPLAFGFCDLARVSCNAVFKRRH